MVDYCLEYKKFKDKHGDQTVQGQALKLLCAIQEDESVDEMRVMVKDSCARMNTFVRLRLIGEE